MDGAPEPREYSQTHLDRGSLELEQRITARIIELVPTEVGKNRLRKMKGLQLSFFSTAIKRIYFGKNREITRPDYLALMCELMDETDFVCEAADLNDFCLREGIVVVVNHLGIAKATKISKATLIERLGEEGIDATWLQRVNTPPNDEPFPLRKAAVFKAMFEVLGEDKVAPHEIHMWYPYPFDEIQKDCGIVGVYLDRPNRYLAMEEGFDRFFLEARAAKRIPIAIISPEMGTTGKRTQSGNPYELSEFKAGFARYAAHRRVSIIPVILVVGKNAEFRTNVLNPFKAPQGVSREGLRGFATHVRTRMQEGIDMLLKSAAN